MPRSVRLDELLATHLNLTRCSLMLHRHSITTFGPQLTECFIQLFPSRRGYPIDSRNSIADGHTDLRQRVICFHHSYDRRFVQVRWIREAFDQKESAGHSCDESK